MATIPQITRDQLLKSSVVGTPGVNPLPEAAGKAIGAGATEMAGSGFDIAIQQQGVRREGQFASLMLGHDQRVMNYTEQIKQTMADTPDAMGPAVAKFIRDDLDQTARQQQDPFLKLMVPKGSGYGDIWALRQANMEAFQQGYNNTVKHGQDSLDDMSKKFGNFIDGNPDLNFIKGMVPSNTAPGALTPFRSPQTIDEVKEGMGPYIHAVGELVTSVKDSAHPQLADEFQYKGMQSLMRTAVDRLTTQGSPLALALTQDPDFTKWFSRDKDPDLLEKYQTEVPKKLIEFQQMQQFNSMMMGAAKNPALMQMFTDPKSQPDMGKVMSLAQRYPDDKVVNKWVQNFISADPGLRAESDDFKLNVLEQARKLGLDKEPGSKVPLTPTQKVDQLINFHLMLEAGKPALGADYDKFTKELAAPLTAAVVQAHTPHIWDQIRHPIAGQGGDIFGLNLGGVSPGNIYSKMTGDPRTRSDNWCRGYDVINDALKNQGITKEDPRYVGTKLQALSNYIDQTHKLDNPNFLDSLGRKYTPESLAQATVGENFKVGGMWSTPVGMRKITGFRSPGNPTFDFSDSDVLRFKMLTEQEKNPASTPTERKLQEEAQ